MVFIPAANKKVSGKPDSCAGARLCQQTFSLGAECASPGGFLLYRTQFPINLHAPTSSHTTINEILPGALGIPELRPPNRR